MLRSNALRTAMALCLFAVGGAAVAEQSSGTFNVTARTRGNCLVSAQNLAFADYVPAAGDVDAESQISVRCTTGTAFDVALNGGSTAGGSIGQRLMASGSDVLQYNLYTDAARTTLWGDGSEGVVVSGEGEGMSPAKAQIKTVYGRLPDSLANQDAPPGDYSDVITVTVTF